MSMDDEYEFCLTWKIENFSYCYPGIDLETSFKADVLRKNLCILILYPPLGGDKITSCQLWCYGGDQINIDYRVEMIDPSGLVLISTEGKHKFTEQKNYLSILAKDEELDMQSWSEDVLTIRCFIRNPDPKARAAIASYYEARTKIGVDRQSFVLESRESKIFEKRDILNFQDAKFVAEISKPKSSAFDNLTIKMYHPGTQIMIMRCKTTLVNNDDNSITKSVSHIFNSNGKEEVWEFCPFINLHELHNSSSLDCNQNTWIQFEFSVTNGVILYKKPTIKSNDMESATLPKTNLKSFNVLSVLQNDLLEQYTNKKHADVKLNAGTTTFLAHKFILMARSPVFAAMFDQTGIVDVKDVDEKSLNAFLEYLYTGIVNIMDYESAKNLLLVADKYQVLSLREKCSSQLMGAITAANVCEVITVADMITDDKLKKSALDFMTLHTVEVMQGPEWSQWSKSNSLLSIEILSNIVLGLKKSSK